MGAGRKQELRRQLVTARKLRPDQGRSSYAGMRKSLPDRPVIAAYQPMTTEPDVSKLCLDLLNEERQVILPKVVGKNLTWHAAETADFAQPEPGLPVPHGPQVSPNSWEEVLMLVPALAVDPTTGARLGKGAGFYDRFLAQLAQKPTLVAVVFADEVVQVPAESHDQPVAAILTEATFTSTTG